jgi:hypothetical protein
LTGFQPSNASIEPSSAAARSVAALVGAFVPSAILLSGRAARITQH